jgi:hypothetical protein
MAAAVAQVPEPQPAPAVTTAAPSAIDGPAPSIVRFYEAADLKQATQVRITCGQQGMCLLHVCLCMPAATAFTCGVTSASAWCIRSAVNHHSNTWALFKVCVIPAC